MRFGPGKVIGFTHGVYSDFVYAGSVVTLKEFNLRELVTEYIEEFNASKVSEWAHASPYGFLGWLVVKEYAMPLEQQVVHLGDYDINDFFTEHSEEE